MDPLASGVNAWHMIPLQSCFDGLALLSLRLGDGSGAGLGGILGKDTGVPERIRGRQIAISCIIHLEPYLSCPLLGGNDVKYQEMCVGILSPFILSLLYKRKDYVKESPIYILSIMPLCLVQLTSPRDRDFTSFPWVPKHKYTSWGNSIL